MKRYKWQGLTGFGEKDTIISRLVALFFLLLIFALFSPESSAQIYKYVDKDGAVHFTDTPTDPRYKSHMGAEPKKKEAPDIQPRGAESNDKNALKGNHDLDDLDNLDDLDDLDNLDKSEEFEELPPLPAIP